MAGHGQGVSASPNLTPILDMVFQLITFFVLIFNAKQAETAEGVDLPVIGSARPIKFDPNTKVIVFNLKFEDPKRGEAMPPKSSRKPEFWVMGAVIPADKLDRYVAAEAASSMLAQHITDEEIHNGQELKDIIVVRADVDIPFKMVNDLITACQVSGFRQFAFKAQGVDARREAGTP
ncbi:MAG: biopolymer transporter ExbD [Thermoguttaceae bacterium]